MTALSDFFEITGHNKVGHYHGGNFPSNSIFPSSNYCSECANGRLQNKIDLLSEKIDRLEGLIKDFNGIKEI
jgi:hypothetical protein